MKALRATPGGLLLAVKAKPGARRDAVLGWRGDALLVAVAAAPEAGRANAAVAAALEKFFSLPRGAATLRVGAASRNKSFFLQGLTRAAAEAALAAIP